jgi:hypothetical protein
VANELQTMTRPADVAVFWITLALGLYAMAFL